MSEAPSIATASSVWDRRAMGALLLLCTVWLLAVRCPFVGELDDAIYVLQNPMVLHLPNLPAENPLTSTRGNFWLPATWLSLMLDATLFGPGPAGFHLTNVLLHAANVLLFYRFLSKATGAVLRSFLAAALYGVHPLRVESVAWVTERKDVLSAFFGLLALLAYAHFAQSGRRKYYWWSAGLLVLSLASKPMLVTFPFLLLLVDAWPLGWMSRQSIKALLIDKLPFAAIAATFVGITYWVQLGHMVGAAADPARLRAENAVLSYALYVRDMVYFGGLCVWYPRPLSVAPVHFAAAAAVLAAITAAVLWGRRGDGGRARLVGWLWFLGTLVPVIGVLQSGEQGRADRFTYFPALGLAIVAGWLVPQRWLERAAPRRAVFAIGAAAIAVCLLFTTLRLQVWRDPLTLYQDALAKTHDNWVIEMYMGDLLLERQQPEAAMASYERAVTIAPRLHEIQNNLGSMLAKRGRLDLAVEHFRLAHETIPGNPVYASNYARAQAMLATRPAGASSGPGTHPLQEQP